jgi:hypothetical protein
MTTLENDYLKFLSDFKANLVEKTKNLSDFLKFLLNISQCLLNVDEHDARQDQNDQDEELDMSESKVFELINSASIQATSLNLAQFKKILFNDMVKKQERQSSFGFDLKLTFKKLAKLVNSNELSKFNTQIVSYMAEQLIHKAALNGHLKFACEIMRKKSSELLDEAAAAAATAATTSTSSNANNKKNSFSLANSSTSLTLNNEQDEKIFKLASELLLSDEDCLRKLSSQVLNEASHLTQLNCVLNTLKKIRWKHLKCEMSSIENLSGEDDDESQGEEEEEDEDEDEEEEIGSQLNYILDVLRDVFMQHECQISDQLSEVHKLMSISSDDDLLAHLQNQNFELHQELNQLKLEQQQQQQQQRINFNREKKTKQQLSGNQQIKIMGASSSEKKSIGIGNDHNHHHHHHHILTGTLSYLKV